MKIVLSLLVVAAVASSALGILEAMQSETLSREAPYESENADMDYEAYQYQRKGSAEIEGDDGRDEEFDNTVCDESGRPREPPSSEISAVFEKQKSSIAAQAKQGGIDVDSISLKVPYPFAYYTSKPVWKPTLKCCPRVWKYGCRHVNQRMPCFVNYHNNMKEWCCPLWPGVYTARCLCDKCAIQTSTCIHQGRCLKRYSRRNFLAVCYRGSWGYLRYFSRWLPSSCHCSAKYSVYQSELTAQKCEN